MKIDYRFGELRTLPEGESRKVEFIISSEKRDRHKTILLAEKWELKNFNKNGIVGYEHDLPIYDWFITNSNPDRIIGKGTAVREDKIIVGTVDFEPEDINPVAEKVFRKVKHGTLKSTSVGFFETKKGNFGEGNEAKGESNETYYYGGQELLEFSIVSIPSNTDATKRGVGKDIEFISLLVQQKMPELSLSDIRKLTVGDVLDILEGRNNPAEAERAAMEVTRRKLQYRTKLLELIK